MIEQAGVSITWYAHFTSSGIGKTGLTPTITIYKDTSATPEVNAQAMTELASGFYYYQQTPSGEGFRVAVCITADSSVDQRQVPAIAWIGKAGVEHLDGSIASRSNHSAADAAAVWNRLLADITMAGSIGKLLKDDVDAAISTRAAATTTAKESSLDAIKGEGWSASSDSLDQIREAIANIPSHRQTQEV